ncbi:hypothetical protein SLEP1_g47084 [Rubroshorea leprosula]|uniref:Uncharacterized protein n=1 Tax=Rubroshorea leprosula TaxID=152421 RepID=A0AAV5LQ69_9ROSI|nr:hypothetical protein SLEP1_g47084 [Rubroshorea leprosula]
MAARKNREKGILMRCEIESLAREFYLYCDLSLI